MTWQVWLEWLSPMKYAFSALARNEFANLTFYCKEDQYRVLGVDPLGNPITICPITNGDIWIDNVNIQEFLSIPLCQALLATMAVAFTVLAYFGLAMASHAARARGKAKRMPTIASNGQAAAQKA